MAREVDPERQSSGRTELQDVSRYHVPAAARTLALLELLAEAHEPLGVSEIARELGIPKSSAFALLSTLDEYGYATRNADDEWFMTLRLHHVGMRAATNVDLLVVAPPIIDELSSRTGMTAHLGMFDGRAIVYVLKAEPADSMIKFDTYPGRAASAHLTAIGRAVSSALNERELARLIAVHGFRGGHKPRIRDRKGFMEELERVRELGYSVEREEEHRGVMCMAAPVSYADGSGAAAVGVTGLTTQFDEVPEDSVATPVLEAAASLSAALDHSGRRRFAVSRDVGSRARRASTAAPVPRSETTH